MPDSRNYYVLCGDACEFESMTKEQILAAITQAVEGHTVADVDTGFVTTIKEQNHNTGIKFWMGTMAEYNALSVRDPATFYIVSDSSTLEDLNTEIAANTSAIEALANQMNTTYFDYSIAVTYESDDRAAFVSTLDYVPLQRSGHCRINFDNYQIYKICDYGTEETNAERDPFKHIAEVTDTSSQYETSLLNFRIGVNKGGFTPHELCWQIDGYGNWDSESVPRYYNYSEIAQDATLNGVWEMNLQKWLDWYVGPDEADVVGYDWVLTPVAGSASIILNGTTYQF